MTVDKEKIIQIIITITITIIVGVVGCSIFGIDAGVYSGITAGLSVMVGKEYGDSLSSKNNWNWADILSSCIGVAVGTVICITLYLLK